MGDKGVKNNAFLNNTNITSVEFGGDCSYVGNSAFRGCTSLKEINADNKLTEVKKYAFANTNLRSVTFNNLKTIEPHAFEDCVELSSITIQRCNTIGSSAFKGCKNLNTVNNKKFTITPTVIYDEAFKGCKNLNNISLEYCNDIKTMAFQNCIGLTKISLNRCINIGSSAFKGCENLSQISLSVCSNIYEDAFVNCKNLTRVYIPNTSPFAKLNSFSVFHMKSEDGKYNINTNTYFYISPNIIGEYKKNKYWKEYIDYMITTAGEKQIIYKSSRHAEEDLDNVIENLLDTTSSDSDDDGHYYYRTQDFGLITFKSEIYILNFKLFTDESKQNITSIDIPPKCTKIDKNMFEGYKNLTNVTILTDSLLYISDFAFKDCESLTSFTIPDSVIGLGEGIFAGCKNLKRFEGNYTKYDNKAIVYNGILISVVPIDDSITEGRFYNISDIGENIQILGKSCFQGCEKLRRVNIPSNIEKIHDNAFDGCKNLCEVHFEGTTPPTVGENVFGEVRSDFKIFVPETSLSQYYSVWGDNYKSYIYPKPTNNSVIYCVNDGEPILKHDSSNIKKFANGIYYIIPKISNTLDQTFKGKSNVTTVILNENIKVISKNAFEKCTGLEYIYMPDTIMEIQSSCFSGCESLTRIHIPSGLESPSNYGITQNNILTQTFQTTKTKFGTGIFDGCKNLKEFGTYIKGIVTDDNMCYINNIWTLKFFAQGGLNTNNDSITYKIPENIQIIDESVFRGSNITSITLPENVRELCEYVFADCNKLKEMNFSPNNNILTIPNGAFENCVNLENINNLPNTITKIGDYAFNGCTSLNIPEIPNTITQIGDYAFNGCTSLNTKIPNSITSINKYVFAGCENLTQVNINNNVTTINESAFSGCKKLNTISFPNNSKLSKINKNAFKECINLINISLPNDLTTIGDNAFENCKLENLTLPNKLTSIGNSAFKGCSIKNITFPDSLTSIGNSAFENAFKEWYTILEYSESGETIPDVSIEIPSSVTNLGNCCFKNSGIRKLHIPIDCKISKIPEGMCENCKNLHDINILSTHITTIDSNAFSGCVNLCRTGSGILNIGVLTLPKNITTINDYAFYECECISSLNFPKNIKYLGNKCFATGINTQFYIYTETPPSFTINKSPEPLNGVDDPKSKPFGDIDNVEYDYLKLPRIYVPNSIYLTYIRNNYWKVYNRIIYSTFDEISQKGYHSQDDNINFNDEINNLPNIDPTYPPNN